LELINSAKAKLVNPGLFTDIIVGFPGETEKDFQDTVDLIKQVEFDGCFIFKYSPRQGTAAFNMRETLDNEEKVNRIKILNKIQDEISLKKNRKMIGKTERILVEGPSKKAKPNQYMGRTESSKIVVFTNPEPVKNSFINVKIVDVQGHTLFGEKI
ncbi:hypothetical protein B6I21_07105, partial [candidate division KSB1 bacterium 4572_119]